MKFGWKKLAAGLLSGLMLVATVGCGSGDKAAEKKEILKVGVSNFADNLEPTNHAIGWTVVRYGLGECLTKFDKQMNVVPWLAESWKVSDDKLTWTFKVSDKAKFSNGNKVTAAACKASIERAITRSVEAKNWANIASVEASGQELTIKTNQPMSGLPGVLGDPFFVIIDTSVTDRDYGKQGPICTGPYTVRSFTRDKAIMDANPNYWDGPVPFKTVDITSIDDPNTRAMALQKGDIDVAVNIAFGDMELFRGKPDFRISEVASIRDVLARINVSEGRILADKRVRQALISSLDREAYCNVLLKKTFIPGGPAMPPSLDFGFNELKDPNAYNVDRAKTLLAEAGWKDSDGDGILDKDGKPLSIKFTYYSSRAELPMFVEAAQADAAKVGIKIVPENMDYGALDAIGVRGDYDLLISNIMTEQAGSPLNFITMYWKSNIDGQNPQNASGYSNKQFDMLADRFAAEFDPAKRRQILIDMQKILLEDAATIIFGYPTTNIISRKDIANADIQTCDYYWLTKDWKLAE